MPEGGIATDVNIKLSAADINKMPVLWQAKPDKLQPLPQGGNPAPERKHSEKPFWEPLQTNNLDAETAEYTSLMLQNVYEDSGFLEPDNPTVVALQGYLDQMKDPTKPATRLLVARNTTESNAYILPDGTIVIHQQLINDLDSVDELVAVIAHEQHHFERNHLALQKIDWDKKHSHNLKELLDMKLGQFGLSRVHEYDADFATPAKLNALGLDTMALASGLRKLGRSNGKNNHPAVDFTHGNVLDRALNIALAHRIIDFPSLTESESQQPISAEWKQTVSESVSDRLYRLPANDEYKKLLGQAGPVVLREHLNNLQPEPLWSNPEMYQLKQNKKFEIVKNLILSRIDKSDLTNDEKRRAYYLCLSEHMNSSSFERGFNFSSLRGSLYQVKPADFSEEGLQSILSLHTNRTIYEIAGLKSITNQFPELLVGSGILLSEAQLYPEKVRAELNRDVIAGDLSAERLIDLIVAGSKIVENSQGNDYTQRWLQTHIDTLIFKVIQDNKGKDNLLSQVFDILKYADQKHSVNFTSAQLRNIVCGIYGIDINRFYANPKAKELFNTYFKELRQPNPALEAAIQNGNFESVFQAYLQNPSVFQEQLARLIVQPEKISPEAKTAIVQIMAERMRQLHYSEQTDLSPQTKEAFAKASLSIDLSTTNPKLIEQFNQLSSCLDSLLILSSCNTPMNERISLLQQFFQNPKVIDALKILPLPCIDSLYRKIITETKNASFEDIARIVLSPGIKTSRPIEAKYDLFYNPESANRDAVTSLPFSDIIREKLLEELPTNAGFDDVRKRYAYYQGLMKDIYEYGNDFSSGQFWGSTQTMAEKMSPLTRRFLESLSQISAANSPTSEVIQLYDATKQYLPQDEDKRKILSALTNEIIQSSSFEEALQFMEKEGLGGNITLQTIDQFIEKRVFTYPDYLKCKQVISRIIENVVTKPRAEVGSLVLIDTIFEGISNSMEMVKILEGMVESGYDDTKLRTTLAPLYWHEAIRTSSVGDYARGYRVFTKNSNVDIVGPAAHTFPTFDSVINTLYNLTNSQKMMVLRKLFLSDGGILVHKKYAEDTGKLMTKEMEFNSVLTPLLQNIVSSSIRSGDPVRVFMPIAQSFLPHILHKPNQRGSTSEAAKQVCSLIHKGFNYPGLADGRGTEQAELNKWTPQLVQLLLDKSPDQILSDALASNQEIQNTYTIYQQFINTLKNDLNIENAKNPKNGETATKKLNPIEVILTVGQGLGPPGKRFLQVMGQYFDLPEEYEEKFREVYDAVPGQSKFTAFAIIERQAQIDTATKSLKEDPNFKLLKRIGGGSINTAFLIQTSGTDGLSQLEVLKVKNPNAERFVVETLEEAEKIIADLKQKDPGNRSNYEVATRILGTIKEWVLGDINDKEFPALDKQFSVLHNNQRIEPGIKIAVPSTRLPYNTQLKREEFVAGKTLNNVATKPEFSDITSRTNQATAQLFARQLTQPAYYSDQQPAFLALSDVHAGNVMIHTPEFAQERIAELQKEGIISEDDAKRYLLQYQLEALADTPQEGQRDLVVKPIDRTYFMKLTPPDTAFLKVLYSDQSPEDKLKATVSYFLAQPENAQKRQQGITPEKLYSEIYGSLFRQTAITAVKDRLQRRQTQTNGLKLMTKLLHEFDRRGINIPLKIRIIQKDVDAINKMLTQTSSGQSFSDYLSQKSVTS